MAAQQIAKSAFAPDPERRALIAKVHVAKKEMALTDDDYRGMLVDVTGQTSSANCNVGQLRDFVEALKKKGFQAKPARGRGKPSAPAAADHPTARKARAMWISLHQLGAIDNPSEQALEAFAKRQLKVERLQWADQALGYKLVEALKAIAERHGWSQELNGMRPAGMVKVLKLRLCEAILVKLKAKDFAGADWSLGEAAFRLCGMNAGEVGGVAFWGIEQIEILAQGLGRKLRGER